MASISTEIVTATRVTNGAAGEPRYLVNLPVLGAVVEVLTDREWSAVAPVGAMTGRLLAHEAWRLGFPGSFLVAVPTHG